MLRVVFMGSAAVSCTMLDALATDGRFDVVGVVAQPDKPRGRRGHAKPCQVKARALELGIPVITPEKINSPEALTALEAFSADLMAVVAYGQFLGRAVREMSPMGCVNIHLSLLPKYRGAAPVQWSIVHGEHETGVTAMLIDAGMDTGDILQQERVLIGDDETAGELHDRLAVLGADLLLQTLQGFVDGTVSPTPQRHEVATLAPKMKKSDGRIDWTRPAYDICLRIRGFNPWPGSYCMLPDVSICGKNAESARGRSHQGPMFKIHVAVQVDGEGKPGEVLCCGEDGLRIATGCGAICIRELQPEGRRRMTVADYVHGHSLCVGDLLK